MGVQLLLGDLRSRVVINVDQPAMATDIVKLAAHEVTRVTTRSVL